MKVFLDASVIVEAALLHSDKFEVADALIQPGACTSIHALVDAYATLSGDKRLKINPHDAAEMVLDCASKLETGSLSESNRWLSLKMRLRDASLEVHFTMPSMLKPLEKWGVQKSTHLTKTTSAMSRQTSKSPHYNFLLSGLSRLGRDLF